ncbi:hypothetical protein Tco_0237606 [Tanacetum coccineum]
MKKKIVNTIYKDRYSKEYYTLDREIRKNIDDEERMYDEEDDEVTKELYDDVNVNLGNEDTDMTIADQDPTQSSSDSSDFTSKLLNLVNLSPTNNEISSLKDTTAQHAIFDQRVSTLESEMFELRQTNLFAEAVSSIPGIVDTYLASKMKEVVDVAVQLPTNKPREEAQAENQEFLNQMAYAVAASLSEFKLKKILIDKIEANKSINRSDNQKNLYNALVESYNSDKDIITSYGDVVLLKRGRDDQDKDEDPSARSDRGTTRRKSSNVAETSKDSRSKEKKSSSTSKDASHHKSSGNSAHA